MKIFLPLCTATLLLAIFLPLSAAPSIGNNAMQRDEMENRLQLLENALSRQVEGTLREEMEVLFRHVERKLSGQVEDAALATARQERRLTELENELKQLQKEGEAQLEGSQNPLSELAEKKKEEIRATGDRYVDMVGAYSSVFSVIIGLIALLPTIYSIYQNVSFHKNAKQKLLDIEKIKQDSQELCEKYISELKNSTQEQNSKFSEEANNKLEEMNNLIEKYKEIHKELKVVLDRAKSSLNNPQEKVSPETVDDAQELITNGKGISVLWGQAILAMNAQQWNKACLYFEDILRQIPDDASAHLNLAKCQAALAGSNQVTLLQRQEYLSKVEKYCRDMLQQKDTLSHKDLLNIYFLYSYVKKVQANSMEIKDRTRLYAEAEQLLGDMRAIAPQDVFALGALAELKIQQAAGQTKPEERARLRKEAEQLLLQAMELAPQDNASYIVLAGLKKQQADEQSKPEERARLWKEAEQLLLRARGLAPQDATIYIVLAGLKTQQADEQSKPEERARLRKETEQLLFQAMKLAPQDAKSYAALAQLKRQQAIEQSKPEERVRLREEAEQLLLRARELAPQDAKSYLVLAQLKLQQADDQSKPEERARLREEAEQLLLRARELAPQEANLIGLLAELKLQQADDQSKPEEHARLRKEAEQLLLQAMQLAPQDAKSYLVLAQLKAQQADDQSKPENRARLRKEAEQLFLKAEELAPQDATIYEFLAELKRQQAAEQSTPEERARLREKAERLFLQAKKLNPKEARILNMLTTLKIEQTRDAAPEDRDGLLAAAETYLAELLPQDSAKGLYNRACIAALRGQHERALELLEECRKAGTLLPREHLEKAKDMDSLRDLDAFREFLKRAYPTEDTRQPDNAAKENE